MTKNDRKKSQGYSKMKFIWVKQVTNTRDQKCLRRQCALQRSFQSSSEPNIVLTEQEIHWIGASDVIPSGVKIFVLGLVSIPRILKSLNYWWFTKSEIYLGWLEKVEHQEAIMALLTSPLQKNPLCEGSKHSTELVQTMNMWRKQVGRLASNHSPMPKETLQIFSKLAFTTASKFFQKNNLLETRETVL